MKQKTIFEISDNASKQILSSSTSSGSKDWPLRIAVNVDSNGKYNYLMGFDQSKILPKYSFLISGLFIK